MMDRNSDLNYSHAFKIVLLTASLTFLFCLCMIVFNTNAVFSWLEFWYFATKQYS